MGKFTEEVDESESVQDKPPELIQVLSDVVVEYYNATNKDFTHSKRVPTTPREIAKWWAKNEREPLTPQENCQKRTNRYTNKAAWYCPYHDYCAYTLRKFLTLDAQFQDLIIDAKVRGFQWCGDDKDEFIRHIRHYHKFKKDPARAKNRARQLFNNILRNKAGKKNG